MSTDASSPASPSLAGVAELLRRAMTDKKFLHDERFIGPTAYREDVDALTAAASFLDTLAGVVETMPEKPSGINGKHYLDYAAECVFITERLRAAEQERDSYKGLYESKKMTFRAVLKRARAAESRLATLRRRRDLWRRLAHDQHAQLHKLRLQERGLDTLREKIEGLVVFGGEYESPKVCLEDVLATLSPENPSDG